MQKTTCNAGDMGSIPGLGRFPGEGNGNPLQYSCLENPVDRGAWWATVHGLTTVGHDLVTKPHYGFPQDIKCSSPCSAWELVYSGYMHTFLYIQLSMFYVNQSWYVQWNMVPVEGRWGKKSVSQHEKIWLTLLWCLYNVTYFNSYFLCFISISMPLQCSVLLGSQDPFFIAFEFLAARKQSDSLLI